MQESKASADSQTTQYKAVKPLLKWAGGKRALVDSIMPELCPCDAKYYEPFLGGAALFFHLVPRVACLSDINSELIECYQTLQVDPEPVADLLATMVNSEAEYYRIRQSTPQHSVGRAARFIYLTTLSFNGIYRQNLQGEFNVPYGKKTNKSLPNHETLFGVSKILESAILKVADFEEATSDARVGDAVYFDPPYTVAHNNNGFVKYNKQIFSWEDQVRLSEHAKRLAERGCKVVVSNADHDSVRSLYAGFEVRVIHRFSVIAAKSLYRRSITECLFVSPAR